MTTKDLVERLGLKPLSKFEDRDVDGVFVSDMLSDVMAGAKSGNLWLTIQTHKSIVPAANLVDVSAIVVTTGKKVPRIRSTWPAGTILPSSRPGSRHSNWWVNYTVWGSEPRHKHEAGRL